MRLPGTWEIYQKSLGKQGIAPPWTILIEGVDETIKSDNLI